MLRKLALFCLGLYFVPVQAQPIQAAAERTAVYLPLLRNKKLAVFANHTSMIGQRHLVDTLRSLGIHISVVFGPEHGFRGDADAGAKVGNYTDPKTGVRVVSLYGAKRRPSAEDLKDIDIMLFDIQDVGVRFYTYISSLEEYMNAAFEYGKPLLILDRPNPNGFYIDGPVLDRKFKSFVGMQSVPIVYGMTIGEYAMMISGEGWLSPAANAKQQWFRQAKVTTDTPFHFLVIKCGNYTHQSRYELPVKPSPNLPDMQSIYLYPSTCLFEGTQLSEGRGTKYPFQVFGHPELPRDLYAFTPVSMPGAQNPKLKDKTCYGWNLRSPVAELTQKLNGRIDISWLLKAYALFPDKKSFFLLPASGKKEEAFFNKLAGNATLMQQIVDGKSVDQIRDSWEPELARFREVRKKYLIYPE